MRVPRRDVKKTKQLALLPVGQGRWWWCKDDYQRIGELGYCMSPTEERRVALRERIRAHLPIRTDGSIHLIARAWAIRGRVP